MDPSRLLPLLETIKNRDQARMRDVRYALDAIEAERRKLLEPSGPGSQSADLPEQFRAYEKHLLWKQQELRRLDKLARDLQPEIEAATAAYSRSFGRLEAVRRIASGAA